MPACTRCQFSPPGCELSSPVCELMPACTRCQFSLPECELSSPVCELMPACTRCQFSLPGCELSSPVCELMPACTRCCADKAPTVMHVCASCATAGYEGPSNNTTVPKEAHIGGIGELHTDIHECASCATAVNEAPSNNTTVPKEAHIGGIGELHTDNYALLPVRGGSNLTYHSRSWTGSNKWRFDSARPRPAANCRSPPLAFLVPSH
jgi:hypothetical protein